jgi:site-specific DNA-cytosine methylase
VCLSATLASMRTTIDLFAGAGGASLGIKNAGMHHALCVEWDEDAASTLIAAGFPGVCGDVRDFKHYEDIKHIDMMWASPEKAHWMIGTDGHGHSMSLTI